MKKKFFNLIALICFVIPCAFIFSACGAHSHDWSSWRVETPAGCETPGSKTRYCLECDEPEQETIAATGHNYEHGYCTYCGGVDPNWDFSLIDGSTLTNIAVSSSGVLSWAGLRSASGYTLKITDSSKNVHTYSTTDKVRSIDLTSLSDGFSLEFGKNAAVLTAFKTEQITLDGESYNQEVSITSDSFNIVNLNSGYSIVRKTYTDEYVTMKDVYSTVYHDDAVGDYLIYEKEATAQQFSYSTSKTSFPLYKNISATNSNYSIRVYESEADKLAGNVYDEGNYSSNLIKLVGGDTKWIIIDVVDENDSVVKSYNILLYCVRSLNVNVYKVTREAPNSDGEILVSNEDYTQSLTSTKVWENDILDINMIYNAIPTGMLVRNKNFEIYEKNTDYNTKDMLIEGNGENATINLYFSEEKETREHQAEVEAWSKYYTLSYKSGYSSTDAPTWNITYKDNYNDQTIVVPATIVGFKTDLNTYSFNNSNVKSIIFETGTTSIPEKALFTCDSLTSVKIPSTVTSVGVYLFSSKLSSPEILLEGDANTFNSDWNRIASSINYYSYSKNQTDCCSIVNEGGAKIKVDVVNKTAIVVGANGKNVVIPENVSYGINQYPVTAIESLTGTNITTLTIPKTITQISTNSYGTYDIPSTLEQLVVDSENASFASYENVLYNKDLSQIIYIPKSIGTLKLSETITEISGSAFNDFHKLETVYIHAGVTNIANGSFDASVTEFIVDSNNQNYKSDTHLFSKDGTELIRWATASTETVVPQTITKIHKCALYGYKWSEITIPFVGESATSNKQIGYMFNSQSNNYNLPNTLTTITISGGQNLPDKAFASCNKLTTINLPNTLTTIGEKAFNGCTSLTSIEIPTSVTTIGAEAFTGCINVTRVETSDLKSWFNIEFKNKNSNPMATSKTFVYFYVNGDIIENLVVPEGVTEIKPYAICNNTKIKSITTSSTVVSIKSYAYNYDNESECPLKTIIFNEGLQTIADNAIYIYLYPNIETVVIPSTVTTIGDNILTGCSNLYNLTVPFVGNGSTNLKLRYFYGLSDNTSIDDVINIGVVEVTAATQIGNNAFNGCTTISEVVLNDSITSIGKQAFLGCKGLTKIELPDSLISIGQQAFSNCDGLTNITIPNSVTNIDKLAFAYCKGLTKVIISNKATSIGSSVFQSCTSLTEVTIPDGATEIGDSMFYGCTSLSEVLIPSSVTTINEEAFYGCTSLTEITIPSSVTTIGESVFYDCSALETIVMSNNIVSIGKNAFYGVKYLTDYTTNHPEEKLIYLYNSNNEPIVLYGCVASTSVIGVITLPNTLKYIACSALERCTKLTEITIPNGVTKIDDSAFYNCMGLTSITIPSSVTSIGSSAFSSCKGLTEIIIPNGVTNIGNYAFYFCTNLTKIIIPSSVTSIGGGAFSNISNTAEFYYLGTQEECDILSGTNVYYYSETEPTTEGNYWHYDTDGKTIVKWTVE